MSTIFVDPNYMDVTAEEFDEIIGKEDDVPEWLKEDEKDTEANK